MPLLPQETKAELALRLKKLERENKALKNERRAFGQLLANVERVLSWSDLSSPTQVTISHHAWVVLHGAYKRCVTLQQKARLRGLDLPPLPDLPWEPEDTREAKPDGEGGKR